MGCQDGCQETGVNEVVEFGGGDGGYRGDCVSERWYENERTERQMTAVEPQSQYTDVWLKSVQAQESILETDEALMI